MNYPFKQPRGDAQFCTFWLIKQIIEKLNNIIVILSIKMYDSKF